MTTFKYKYLKQIKVTSRLLTFFLKLQESLYNHSFFFVPTVLFVFFHKDGQRKHKYGLQTSWQTRKCNSGNWLKLCNSVTRYSI